MDELDHALRYRMMQNLAEETMTHRHSARASAVPIRQYGSFNYWRAEQLMGVGGKAGNLVGRHGVREGGPQLGYHPYPVPTATLSRNYTNPDGVTRSGCAYCGYCSRYGCMIGAKAQPTNILMPVLPLRECSVTRCMAAMPA